MRSDRRHLSSADFRLDGTRVSIRRHRRFEGRLRYGRSLIPTYASIDEAYSILARTGPEYRGGLSNHGPMASEAMCMMGRSDPVVKWVERYRSRLEPHPSMGSRIAQN